MNSEDSGYLALRWNNHEHVFTSLINTLRIQEKYCDVSLSCDGRFFSAHKFVLEACSSYFSTLFQSTPCKHPVIFMRDVTVDQLEAILDFMYKGVIHVEQEQLPGILRTAEALKIKGLAVPDGKTEEQAEYPGDAVPTPIRQKRKLTDDAPKQPQSVSSTPTHPLHISQASDFNLSPPSLKRYKSSKVTQPSLSNDTNPLLALLDTVLATGKEAADTNIETDQDDFTAKSDGSVDQVRHSVNTQLENWNGETEDANAEVLQVDLSADSSQFIIGPAAESIKEENDESGSTSRSSPDADLPPKILSKDSKGAAPLAPKKPFQCPLCGHTFTRRDNLANHLKTHTGDRPFMCQFCHKCFSRKDYLKQHERIHTGEKPYQCTQCDRSFTRKEGMTDHMRCHFESKEFTCDVCNKSFKQKCGLRFHKRNYQH